MKKHEIYIETEKSKTRVELLEVLRFHKEPMTDSLKDYLNNSIELPYFVVFKDGKWDIAPTVKYESIRLSVGQLSDQLNKKGFDELAEMLVVGESDGQRIGLMPNSYDPTSFIKPVLLVSEDGHELREGDLMVVAIFTETRGWLLDQSNMYVTRGTVCGLKNPDDRKAFKSREKAEQWVKEMNGQDDVENHPASAVPYTPNQLEYFAGLALQGMLTRWNGSNRQVAIDAIRYAKALITELNKEEQGC